MFNYFKRNALRKIPTVRKMNYLRIIDVYGPSTIPLGFPEEFNISFAPIKLRSTEESEIFTPM